MLALSFVLAGCPAGSVTKPGSADSPDSVEPAPKPGDPELESKYLERRFRHANDSCETSAEVVVDQQRLCSDEHWAACVYAGSMYLAGCGVAKSMKRAEEFLGRGCAAGSILGCSLQGWATTDPAKSAALLEEPCRRRAPSACWNLGVQLARAGKEADVPRALELLGAACREDLSYCFELGTTVRKWHVESRFYDARMLLERACVARETEACHELATSYVDGSLGTSDVTRAFNLETNTCLQFNYGPSCDALGHMYQRGQGCDKDDLAAAKLFYAACRDGYGPACESIGEAAENGWGGPASRERAVEFYEYACDKGMDHGCQRARELNAQQNGTPGK